jgi:LysM repeat protein
MMTRRIITVAAALAACAASVTAQTPALPPPPPQQADTTEIVYTVKTGDTLWAIAQYYLQNPFRWPEIFRRNTDVVENPHWIYPGEKIRIAAAAVKPDVLAAERSGRTSASSAPSPDEGRTVFASGAVSISRSGSPRVFGAIERDLGTTVRQGEIEVAPFVDVHGGPKFSGKIIGTAERMGVRSTPEAIRFQLNDKVYITLPGNRAARLGDRYLTYALGPELEQGQVVVPNGVLEIDSIRPDGFVRAQLVHQYGEVSYESRLLSEESVPRSGNAEPVVLAGPTSNSVIWVHGDPVLPSLQHFVILGSMESPAIAIGDMYALVDEHKATESQPALPAEDVAYAQVVRVTPFAATAIIVRQNQPAIRVGMRARRTERIP